MPKSAQFWQNRADEVRAIADCIKVEETRRMMAAIAADYDHFAIDAKRLETRRERDDHAAKRLRQQQATTTLVAAPFSHTQAQRAIEALMDAPFSRARAR
jgi:hypothetical protein